MNLYPESIVYSLLAFMQGGQWTTTATMFEEFVPQEVVARLVLRTNDRIVPDQ